MVVGRLLRLRRPLLRRGRLAAPGTRGRDDHGALRLQRAVELHRRLGDPARLHPADRAHGVRDHGLRGGPVPAAGGRRRRVPVRRRGRRRRRLVEHPGRRLEALRALLVRRARRPRAADDDRDPRAGAAAQPRCADGPDEHRGHALVVGPDLRLHADPRDVRGRRRVIGPGRRGRGRPPRAQAPGHRPHAGVHPLRRHLARGGQRAPAPGRAALGAGQLRRRADARRGRGLRAGMAERDAAAADRPLRVRDPGDRVQRRDARPLAARLLAGVESPDPVRDRPPASDARDARGDHLRRRAARDRAADPGRPRVPRLDLRVRRHDLVHDRPRLGDPPALARARPRSPVQDADEPPHRPRRAAGDRCARRADVGGGVRGGRPPARQRALGRHRLDGVRDRAST